MSTLRAPFPWFGGKSRAASLVWERFGDVPNYVEPFAGSLATLLARPHTPRVETVNDKDAYLANFWRALQAAPDEVAYWADWPVNEADLHARHSWLVNTAAERVERLKSDPDYYDAKIAGWWVWGLCQWIGSGWCSVNYGPHSGRTKAGGTQHRRPDVKGMGTHSRTHQKRPHLMSSKGVHRLSQQLPLLSAAGRGIHSGSSRSDVYAYFEALAERLRYVRVCCGDWQRVMGPSVTEKIGVTAILLDPPYADTAKRDGDLYNEDDLQVAHRVREWALANGDNPMLRIALCGYAGEHEMPETWECVAWKANGGYANQAGLANDNAKKERIWFSPHCLKTTRALQSLFDLEVTG